MAEKQPREFISPEARQCIDRRLYSLQESLLSGECSDSHLSLCAKWLSRKHFMDVCVERAVSSGLCGWPGCENEIKMSKGKVKVSLRDRRIEDMDKWGSYACSSRCQTLGQAFLKSISTTSPYARDVAMAYLNDNENRAVVEGMSKLKMSSEPVLMEIKERPQVAPVQSITADISFSIDAQTMAAPSMQMGALTERYRKSDGESDITPSTHQHRSESYGKGGGGDDVEDAAVVDVESDAVIWHEVLNSDMPNYLGEDTSLLDHECFAYDSHHYSNHVPISTFIVLWKAFTEWQPLEMKDSSSTQRMGGGLSTSEQRAEVLSSMVLQRLPEVAVILGQDKDEEEDCLSRFVIGSSDATRIPQFCNVVRERLAVLISYFSMSSEIPDLNQDQWHLVTWVLLCALHSPPVLQNEGILGSIALEHIESLGVSCAEFFVLVRVGKDLVTI